MANCLCSEASLRHETSLSLVFRGTVHVGPRVLGTTPIRESRLFGKIMTKWSPSKPLHWRSRQLWVHRLPALLLGLGSLTLLFQMMSLPHSSTLRHHRSEVIQSNFLDPLPRAAAEWEVSEEDLLHLSLLHERCMTDSNAILPWHFGSPGHQGASGTASNPQEAIHEDDPDVLDKLRQCPEVDIFLPIGLHGNGYCEDGVAYAKCAVATCASSAQEKCGFSLCVCITFGVDLKSRLLPVWALEKKFFDPEVGHEVDYYDLCPGTPLIFFNHYWDGVPDSPRWPKSKPLYLMPNIEMIELTPEHYWRADVVLCKTQVCYDRVTKWYEQEGNPRNAQVFYTKHTSSDQAQFARKRLGDNAIAPKDFFDIRFIHTPGTSIWKGTKEILDCWTSTRGLPPLELYMDEGSYNYLMRGAYGKWVSWYSRSTVNLHFGMMDRVAFSKLTAEAAFLMCPSLSEGYGHYINQARASGAVIITTDAPPMNELILSSDMGVLVPTRIATYEKMMLGGDYSAAHGLKHVDGLLAAVTGDDICESVQRLVSSTTTEQLAAMGANARKQYHKDTKFFAQRMHELRKFATNQYTYSQL
jgi:glycosyltransferase involved in cell wall biosynthesis